MNIARAALSAALSAGFGTLWAMLRRRRPAAHDALGVVRASCGFLAVVFLLKIVPALIPPRGLLRDDFLFPLWALWRPATAWWWFGAALLLAGAVIVWTRFAASRAREGVFLAGAVVLACLLWTSLALTHEGWPEGLVSPFLRRADYRADVGRFDSFGAIWSGYTDVQPSLSVHGRTHPPGAVALLWLLGRATGGRLPLVCLAVVLLGALALVPLHRWARRLLTPEEARAVCLLWIFTPAVTLYGATCMDMVFALVLALPVATFVALAAGRGGRGSARAEPGANRATGRDLLRGALLGVMLAAGFLFTFSTAVLAVTFAFVALSRLVRRESGSGGLARALLAAGVVAGALLLALRPLAGFDWLACLGTAARLDAVEAPAFLTQGYYLTTRLMGVLDFLVLAGVAAAPIALGALGRGFPARAAGEADTRRGDTLVLTLWSSAAAAAGAFLLLGAFKIGETGRIFLFLAPLVAATVVRRLDAGTVKGGSSGLDVTKRIDLMTVLSLQFTQTLLMQAFLDTRW